MSLSHRLLTIGACAVLLAMGAAMLLRHESVPSSSAPAPEADRGSGRATPHAPAPAPAPPDGQAMDALALTKGAGSPDQSFNANLSALRIVNGSEPVALRLLKLEGELGPDAYLTNAYRAYAKYACQQLEDPALVSTAEEDGTKAWALHNWRAQCERVDASTLSASRSSDVSKAQQLFDLVNKGDDEAVGRIANEAIAEALLPGDVQLAVSALIETGGLDLGSLNPGFRLVPQDEQMSAIAHASQLVLCARTGGCPSNSLTTAVFCTISGCPPGSDFERAVSSALPARQLELVRALQAWLQVRITAGKG